MTLVLVLVGLMLLAAVVAAAGGFSRGPGVAGRRRVVSRRTRPVDVVERRVVEER